MSPRDSIPLDMDKAVIVTSKVSMYPNFDLGNLERKFMQAQLKQVKLIETPPAKPQMSLIKQKMSGSQISTAPVAAQRREVPVVFKVKP